jgi:hypothetical protein
MAEVSELIAEYAAESAGRIRSPSPASLGSSRSWARQRRQQAIAALLVGVPLHHQRVYGGKAWGLARRAWRV